MNISTTVTRASKNSIIVKGSFLGATGALLLVFASIFLPPNLLEIWGLPLLLLAGGLIAAGLFPYRKLCRLELNPDHLISIPPSSIVYTSKGKTVLQFDENEIEEVLYIENKNSYGIEIILKKSAGSSFLPYFSERSAEELRNFLSAEDGL